MSQLNFTRIESGKRDKSKPKILYDYYFNIIIIGTCGVGKTCILQAFNDQKFVDTHITTIGIDFITIKLKTEDNKNIRLVIWDCAGHERFHSITKQYYQKANGIVLVCDVTKETSITEALIAYFDVKKIVSDIPPVIFVGNKIDLEYDENNVKLINELVDKMGIDCIYTSAKNRLRIDEVFHKLTSKMIAHFNQEKKSNKDESKSDIKTNIITISEDKPKKGCCSK